MYKEINKLTIASMFAAMAFICFAYLRIEIPMWGGMTGKIYIGHAFLILSALITGAKWGALTGAVGLSLADILSGYTISAPPTFVAKFLIGLTAGWCAYRLFDLPSAVGKKQIFLSGLSAFIACLVNVLTEPVIRYAFKVYVMGYPQQVAYLSALNCAISMAVSALPSIIAVVVLYHALQTSLHRQSSPLRHF